MRLRALGIELQAWCMVKHPVMPDAIIIINDYHHYARAS